MFRTFAFLAMSLLACAVAQAAPPTSTTITVTATGSIGLSGATVTGQATFTNGIPSGTFSATASLTNITGATVTVPFAITSGSSNQLSGTITLSTTLLLGGGAGTGNATITSATGTYAGDTYSFPNLTGTGTLSGTTVSITFTGTGTLATGGGGGGTTTPAPTITKVLDSASNTPNIAEGSIFIVQGSNLCPSGTTFYNVPRPTVGTDGVKITFTPTAGGAGTDALLWYEYNPSGTCQLAGILQSTVAPGSYNVTVTNGSVSAPFSATVVQRKLTLFTQDSTGSGLASVQNYISASRVDLNSFTSGNGKGTTISPAHPGQFLLAYGTGMGPLVGGDNSASPAYDFSANGVTVQAIVGGMTLPVAYAGRAGYAGEDQINVALPNNVPTGCTVSFQISVNGALSNTTFIAIAPDATSTACVLPGFTTAQLQAFDQGGTYTAGSFAISTESATEQGQSATFASASGAFARYTAYQLSSAPSSGSSTTNTSGSCTVTQFTSGQTAIVTTPSPVGLDAGAITLMGPAASGLNNQALTETTIGNAIDYVLTIGNGLGILGGVNGSIVAGAYTFIGAGGKDIGKFSAPITLGAPLVVTGGLPATVVRNAGLTLSWTGGNPTDIVDIIGSAGTTVNGVLSGASFLCYTTAGAGTFTVPASILNQLPAASVSLTGSSTTSLAVGSGVVATFTAPLTAGGNINFGVVAGVSEVAGTPTYQ